MSTRKRPEEPLTPRTSPVRLSEGVILTDGQERAIENWLKGDANGDRRGPLEIFTGGGKALIATVAFTRLSRDLPNLRLRMVVLTGLITATRSFRLKAERLRLRERMPRLHASPGAAE